MSVRDQVTPEHWKALLIAPGAASTYISTASGGSLEMLDEIFSAGKFFRELSRKTGGSGYGVLVDELLDALKNMTLAEAGDTGFKYRTSDTAGMRLELKQFVANTVAGAKALPDGDGYARWILDMAREVAETKTGGFLGIGGRSVIDEKEQAALDELKTLMDL
jgi:hypothetical protein